MPLMSVVVAVVVVVFVVVLIFSGFKSLAGDTVDCGKLVLSCYEGLARPALPRCGTVLLLFFLPAPLPSPPSPPFPSSPAPRSCCFKNRSCGNMAQSQLLNVHYLRLQPELELSSPEPLHSSRPSLRCSATNTALCTTGAPKRGSEPSKSHPVRPRDGGLTSQGMPVPHSGRKGLRWAKGCAWNLRG